MNFWQVEAYEPNRLLRQQAEMTVPGRAWLAFEVTGVGERSTVRHAEIFDLVSLLGLAYW